MCRKQPGVAIGRLCEKCKCQERIRCGLAYFELLPFPHRLFLIFMVSFLSKCFSMNILGDGKCVICDSFVNPKVLVHICDECNYGSNENRCVVCGNVGVTDAYYCRECVQQEKNRDGCPKVVNLGAVS